MATSAQRDPTRTATLRAEYVAACRKRFIRVRKLINESIVTNDALNLTPNQWKRLRQNAQSAGRYSFPSDPAGKAQAFMDWLRQAADDEILEVTERDGAKISARSEWQNLYVRTAYRKGIDAADRQIERGGVNVPDFEIWSLFNQPMHANTLALLFTRNFEDLNGITDAMALQISRELTMGMARGLGAPALARALNAKVDGIGIRRSILLARTEVIRAFAEGSLNRYEEMGVDEVVGEVEFATAGDQRVCPVCRGLARRTYTIQEARGVIPVHPQCRCAWLPVVRRTRK